MAAARDVEVEVGKLDLNLLAIFDMVMVERHVTRASERLGLTQSAVSNALNRLRRLFDDMLFVKAARGVEPTKRALAIWPDIHAAIVQLQRSVRPGVFDPATARMEFRMSMVDLSAALLTPFLYRSRSAFRSSRTFPSSPQSGSFAARSILPSVLSHRACPYSKRCRSGRRVM